jgi:hypothetical protein
MRSGAGFFVALVLAGCSQDSLDNGPASRGTTTSTSVNISLDAAAISPSGSGGTLGSGTGIVPHCEFTVDPASKCVGDLYGSQGSPVDLYVVFDESGSMATLDDGKTMRIDAVKGAVTTFQQDPGSAGLGVGLSYFGTQPLSCACTSCNAADYSTPSVPVAVLPDNTAALMASLAAAQPTGETPTGPAIRGACAYVTAWQQKHSDRQAAILLVTDGEPQAPLTSAKGGCHPTLADASEAAASCLSTSRVRTYVLGVGPSLTNLNQIAAAGGSSSAYLVQNAGGAGVLAALNAIRKDAQIPCTLNLPAGNIVLSTLNVVYADSACNLTTYARVGSVAACPAQGGWYFDDPNKPSKIQLCQASCDQVAKPGGQLQLSVGCDTVFIP